MSYMLHPPVVQAHLAPPENSSPDCETYQTNLNHPQHSKSACLRLTLVMLWFLRGPLTVRKAVIALLLVPFLASSSGVASAAPVRDPAHANVAHGTVRHTHRSTLSSPQASRSSSGRTSASKSRRTPQTTTRRATSRRTTTHSASRSSTRRTVSSRNSAGVRRTRYAHSQASAHFVPVSNAPVTRSTHEAALESDTTDLTRTSTSDPRAARASASSGQMDSPSQATPDESDSVPEPAEASRSVVGTGNPLADPPAAESSPIPAGTVEIAGLNVPRVYGRYALRGTRDSLVRQNERSEQEFLERIEDDSDLEDRISRGQLIHVPESAGLLVNPALPENRRYCRPWTADFLTDLSRAYEAKFHRPLIVSSAVRTVEYQKRLMRINHNAADAEGDVVSPHLTGATIDIAKSGLSRSQMQWMRDHLFAYQTAGVIDVEEEFRQRCFHITVYKSYAPASAPGKPHHAPVPQTVPPDPSSATITDDSASSNR